MVLVQAMPLITHQGRRKSSTLQESPLSTVHLARFRIQIWSGLGTSSPTPNFMTTVVVLPMEDFFFRALDGFLHGFKPAEESMDITINFHHPTSMRLYILPSYWPSIFFAFLFPQIPPFAIVPAFYFRRYHGQDMLLCGFQTPQFPIGIPPVVRPRALRVTGRMQ